MLMVTALQRWMNGLGRSNDEPAAVPGYGGGGGEGVIERLEARQLLAVNPLGQQPAGVLTDKIVYVHAGHGWTADNLGNGAWTTQRGETFEIVEDMGNIDQMNFYVDYLFNAGATVVPLRPVGHQLNEVVLDNDSVGVTFTGGWSNSSNSRFFGSVGDTPYRYASTASTQTAYATYQPNIPQAGEYPVYTWVGHGSDRAADQLYRITHTGGVTEVDVDHSRVGNGWVYLGSYHFNAGTGGSVTISNKSSQSGKVVIADAIRFGNGMGDINRGGGISGYSREDESGLYWVQAQLGQGASTSEYRTSSSDRTASVSVAPRWAEHMNREASGSMTDRVFLSFHSNAATGTARGAIGLYNNNSGSRTPNQITWAALQGAEINNDLQAIGTPTLEHAWSNRSTDTLGSTFGEINNSYINNEFDATIIETGFHDNQLDAEIMRDPVARDLMARASYQATVRYFNQFASVPLNLLPDPVTDLRSTSVGNGNVTLSWTPPVANSIGGQAATGYRIYTSLDGEGFDGGTYVAGGTTTSYTFTNLDNADGMHYFKVAAVNAGGESKAPHVVAARPVSNGPAPVLIVNGFDRFSRSLNVREAYLGGTIDRVRPDFSNSFDYAVQVGMALGAYSANLGADTVQNEHVINGLVDLTDYDTVIWILGEESTDTSTFNAAERTAVASFISGGGNFFSSGSEIGWDLDAQGASPSFYNNSLHADYVADDAGTYAVSGVTGGIFAGLSLSFDDGDVYYDAEYPDVINPSGGATTALTYAGGGGAAIQFDGGTTTGNVVTFGFPFETILGAANRAQVLGRVLDFFGTAPGTTPAPSVLLADNDNGAPQYTETGSWTTSASNGYNGGGYRFGYVGAASTATWNVNLPSAGNYAVQVQYRAGGNRATAAQYQLSTSSGTQSAFVNQTLNNLQWVTVGTYAFNAGANTAVLNAAGSSGGAVVIADAVRFVPVIDQVADNDAGAPQYVESGPWSTSGSNGYNGGGYRFGTVGAAASATWSIELDAPQTVDVFVQYRAGSNRATSARYNITDNGGVSVSYVNQTLNNLQWVLLGSYEFDEGLNTVTLDAAGSSGGAVVIADAVRFVTNV